MKTESQQTVVFKNEKASHLVAAQFPTTPEIMREGQVLFRKLLQEVPVDISIELIQLPWLHTVFAGTTPEVGGRYPLCGVLTKSAELSLRKFIDNNPDNLVLFDHYRKQDTNETITSIVNKKAATRVITQHQNMFPSEAVSNPYEWLTNTHNWYVPFDDIYSPEAEIVIMRYGLLSGINSEAVKKFVPYRRVVERIRHIAGEKVSSDLREQVRRGKRTRTQIEAWKNYLSHFLTEEECALAISGKQVLLGYLGYIGFNPDLDTKFQERSMKMMNKFSKDL